MRLLWSMQWWKKEKNPTLKVHLKIKPYVHYCRYTGLLDIFDLSYNFRLEFHLFLQQVIEGLDLLGSARWESRVTTLLVARPQQLASSTTTSTAAGHLHSMVLIHVQHCLFDPAKWRTLVLLLLPLSGVLLLL